MQICEHFPLMAGMAHRYAILRSVYHRDAPIHETGHQLLQTGRLAGDGIEWPHYGAVASRLQSSPCSLPPWVVIPDTIGSTGVSISHGQTSGFLGERYE